MSDTASEDYNAPKVVPFRTGIGGQTPKAIGPLNSGGGGGTYDSMEAWQTSVETRLGALSDKADSHLRWLLAAFAAGFVVIGGLVLDRTDAVSDKVEAVGAQVASVKTDIAVLKVQPTKEP